MGVIFLMGPTAVGKSAVALELAGRLGAEIISADSMQVYRGMDIGTAKIKGQLLTDVCDVNEPFDAKRFVELAQSQISKLKSVIICGGTGLYIRALRQGLFEGPGRSAELRARLEVMSVPDLFAELQSLDPQTAASIDCHNPRRLVRAIEVFHQTGKPIREQQTQWAGKTAGNGLAFCLNRDRQELVERIERRIDEQIAAGWVEEVRQLFARGLEKNPTAMQAAGYRELAAHLRGELSLPEAVTLIKIRTRQLAKRQITWFRREPDLTWLTVKHDEKPAVTAERILELGTIS